MHIERFTKVLDHLKAEWEKNNNTFFRPQRLAEKMGTYLHVLNEVKRGKRTLTIYQLTKLHELHNINPNYLLGVSSKMILKTEKEAGNG